VLLSIVVGSGVLIPLLLWLTRGWRRDGVLRYTADQLAMELKGVRCVLDLRQPFELLDGSAPGPGNLPLQVLLLRQGGEAWGFSYGLPIHRKPYGDTAMKAYVAPVLGAETRVVHDRLRARLASPT
jgi:hypothetical protein